jgi:hypothetical protein
VSVLCYPEACVKWFIFHPTATQTNASSLAALGASPGAGLIATEAQDSPQRPVALSTKRLLRHIWHLKPPPVAS